jgi:hypothetical protein
MKTGCRIFDASRMHLLLVDKLPQKEKAEIECHLKGCEACRAALEILSGDTKWWEQARRFVSPELGPEIDADLEATGDPLLNPHSNRWNSTGHGDIWLDFLEPSDDPKKLGRLGTYDVMEVIGKGGMGIVLKAFDPKLDRTVALKVLAPQLAVSGAARRRFAREARAAAAVVHEHVVAIHAVDSWRGLPYLVMQYVPGLSLQERIDEEGPLEIEDVLRIGMQAAAGLAAAHAQGLVHRDVKPSNILLENGVERVKLTDFGLARAADDASVTQSGVLAGTPQYMAPEQANGETVDLRSDLFSLGSVLYAMCAGRPPFRAESTMAVLRRVCEESPRPLSQINPQVPNWLVAIISRLHSKNPAARYSSATEVADLLGRHLAGLREPSKNVPPEWLRHRLALSKPAVAAIVLLMLGVGLGAAEAGGHAAISELVATVFRIRTAEGILVVMVDDPAVKVRVDGEELIVTGTGPQEFRYRPGRHQVSATKDGASVLEKVVTIRRGDREIVSIAQEFQTDPNKAGNDPKAALTAPASTPMPSLVPLNQTNTGSSTDPRVQELQKQIAHLEARLSLLEPAQHAAPIGIYVPYGTGAVLRTPPAVPQTTPAPGVSFTPVQPQAAAAFPNAPLPAPGAGTTGPIAPGAGASEISSTPLPKPGPRPSTVAPPPGATPSANFPIGAGTPDVPQIGRPLPLNDERPAVSWSRGPILCAEYSPNGKTIALACGDGSIVLCSSSNGRIQAVLAGHTKRVWSVAFSPDARMLASAAGDWEESGSGEVKLWDLAASRIRATLKENDRTMFAVAFSPDGMTLASGGRDQEVTIWDVSSGRIRNTCVGHEEAVRSIAFHPDGRTLVSASFDKTIRFWDSENGMAVGQPLEIEGTGPNCVVISPDGKVFASNTSRDVEQAESNILIWDWSSRREIGRFQGSRHGVLGLAFSPDGRFLASGGGHYGAEGEAKLWDVKTGKIVSDLKGHQSWVETVRFSPQGGTLISAGGVEGIPGEIKLWDLKSLLRSGDEPNRPR